MEKIMRFLKDEDGVTMIEYAVLAALIAVASIGIITTIGGSTGVSGIFTKVRDDIVAVPKQ